MNKEINPEILQLFMNLIAVASPDPGAVLPQILSVVENSEAEDYEWDAKRKQLVVALHTDQTETAFCCHMDTVGDLGPTLPIFDAEKGMVTTKGRFTSCLGADCRAGMAIMLYMIQNNVPGYYFFFSEEEKGLLGSQAMAERYTRFPMGVECLIDRIIAFDRKGYNEVITHQAGVRTCSDDFALALSAALNESDPEFLDYKPSVYGGRTDSWSFRGIIPECTNLSVGYFNPHSKDETQNIIYLSKLAEAAVEIDWDDLPVVRDINVIETLTYPKKQESKSETKKAKKKVTSKDLVDIRFVDRAEFIAFAEKRLDKMIPSFHDNPMNRRAFVKMLEYGLGKHVYWETVVDDTLNNKVEAAGTPHKHFVQWSENFGLKTIDEFLKFKYPSTSTTQPVVVPQGVVSMGGVSYSPALWADD